MSTLTPRRGLAVDVDDPDTEFAIIDAPPGRERVELTQWQAAVEVEQRRWLLGRLFHCRRNDHPNARLHARPPGGEDEAVDPLTVYDVRESGRSKPGGPGYSGLVLYPVEGWMPPAAEAVQ